MSIREDIFNEILQPEYALKQARIYTQTLEDAMGRQVAEIAALRNILNDMREHRFRVAEALGSTVRELNKGPDFFGQTF